MQSQKPTNPDPVYKESEILSDLGQSWVRNHPVNPGKAQAQQTCLTDKGEREGRIYAGEGFLV
jgi:hypothetical protein